MSPAFANQIPWAYNQISPDDDDNDDDADDQDDFLQRGGGALSCSRSVAWLETAFSGGISVVFACIELQILGPVLNAAHANRIRSPAG